MRKGFTLIEVLLSITIIAMIVGLSIPIYQSLFFRNDLDIAAETAAHALRRAQLLAQSVEEDDAWGVAIETGRVTLYRGTDFLTRDASYDETVLISDHISPSGLTEIPFAAFTGIPETSGTIVLTSTTQETRSITVNTYGMVEY